jgi:hypothetical protein
MSKPKVDFKDADKYAKEVLNSSMRTLVLENLCLAYVELRTKEWPEGGGKVATTLLEIVRQGLYAMPEGQRPEKTRTAITVLNMLLDYNTSIEERLNNVQKFFEQCERESTSKT